MSVRLLSIADPVWDSAGLLARARLLADVLRRLAGRSAHRGQERARLAVVHDLVQRELGGHRGPHLSLGDGDAWRILGEVARQCAMRSAREFGNHRALQCVPCLFPPERHRVAAGAYGTLDPVRLLADLPDAPKEVRFFVTETIEARAGIGLVVEAPW